MNLLEEYKELYYKEIETASRLDNKITTCITFLTILGSAQILLWTQLANYGPVWYTGIYLALCLLGTVMFFVCIGMFFKAYCGYEMYLFPVKAIAEQHADVLSRVAEGQKEQADRILEMKMAERFINDAIHNRQINAQKNNRHRRLLNTLLLAFAVTFLAYALGVFISFYETKTSEKTMQETVISQEVE